MKLRKILISSAATALMIVLVFSGRAFAFTAKISALEGEVVYRVSGQDIWEKAEEGISLSAGDKVRTEPDSWAEVSFSQGHMTRLGPGSHMKIAALDEETNIELFNGELFSRVRRLTSNESYNITTPESVISVKGTEFSVAVDESLNETLVKVFSGLVTALGLETGEEVSISAGQFSKILKNVAPSYPEDFDDPDETLRDSDLDESMVENDYEDDEYEDPVDEPEDTIDEAAEVKQDLRSEIRSAVSDIRVDVRQAQDTVEQKRETDTSTGRTLRDYHGNLVRVEQHLMRPASNTLHFINITKRDNYRYRRGNFGVESSGSRLDYVETKIEFNRRIPERMSGWFKFIDKISDSDEKDFHPTKQTIRFSNREDSIVMESEWDYKEDDMAEPDITFISRKYGEWKPKKDPEGETIEIGDGIFRDPEDDRISFWSISPGLTIVQGGKEKIIRLGMEGWLINNEGRLFSVKDIETGDINPFQAMRRIAFQLSFMPRYGFTEDYILGGDDISPDEEISIDSDNPKNRRLALEGFNKATDFFSNNIDIVATPDVMFNVLEEIAKNVDLSSIDDDD